MPVNLDLGLIVNKLDVKNISSHENYAQIMKSLTMKTQVAHKQRHFLNQMIPLKKSQKIQ